jgi:hypothetical protein
VARFGEVLALLFVASSAALPGCGGNTKAPAPSTDGAGGERVGAADGAGDAGAPPAAAKGGAPPAPEPETAGAKAGGAGGAAALEPEVVDDGSARGPCEDQLDCADELECTGIPERTQRTCLSHCSTDAACASTQLCVDNYLIEPSCFPLCVWPWDCAYAFDCLRPSGSSEYVCVPTQWSTYFI